MTMGIYIKGIEMPKGDTGVLLALYNGQVYLIGGDVVHVGKGRGFEAVVVPEPHGRLIDADALGDFPYNMDFCDGGEADEWVRNAPTVIPAEPPKEENHGREV